MLRFVQSLQLNNSPKTTDLPVIATKIYRQCFAEFVTASAEGEQIKLNGQKSSTLLQSFDAEPSNQSEDIQSTTDDVWIFGYGSLVWKADFPYIDRRRGYVCGYKRRFYQHSIDHRGIPEKPGRVVTLLPGNGTVDRVYGVAYRIAAIQKAKVLDHLDYREKNGYERFNLEFHEYPATTIPINVIMYVATQSNDSYAGNIWQVPCIAKQIFTSAGPSGPNREYLFNLSTAMRELFPDVIDEHLTELVDCVQRHIQHDEPALLECALTTEIVVILQECIPENVPQQNEKIAERLETLCTCVKHTGWRERMLDQELQRKCL